MKNLWFKILITASLFFLAGEKGVAQNLPDAQQIVNLAIQAHGGKAYNDFKASFDFRSHHFKIRIDGPKFTYERFGTDSIGTYHDVLDNKGFVRFRNNNRQTLNDKNKNIFRNSLNSVVYFALLPHFLNDPAVNKKYLGMAEIKGEHYYKIEVSFDEKGGGDDYQDIFIYWFHQDEYTMDYLAYKYHTNEGGIRFRDAFNVRSLSGILFADYHNYKGLYEQEPLVEHDSLFNNNRLELLSEIELRNIVVNH